MSVLRKRIGLIPVLVLFGLLMIGFLWLSNGLVTDIRDTKERYHAAISTGNDLETAQNKLKEVLASAHTDAFIENQARTLYDYMMPDEIRLVITNPDVLYGTD